ncbi:MAG: NADH:ubiquinone oxidoreductase [Magnetococcales bacterium]|nr:NADH:ubiquinone oxidoreductase [Magnetococcales bacterium]
MAEGLSLYWMQSGGCGGDTVSFLNAESPDFITLFEVLGIDLLWHPSLSNLSHVAHEQILQNIFLDQQVLDILVVEGSIITGPEGTGRFDLVQGQPRKELTARLAAQARYVIALGTCASFGGFGADGIIESVGMQFHHKHSGGLLDASFTARAGLPVINLPGCPCHPIVLKDTLMAVASGSTPRFDEFNRPLDWYGVMVHQGCTRNDYHEYRVEESSFAERGCLFFHLGCHGPLTHGPCNRSLWNRRSSKTRAGVPCFGCTSPDFPQPYPFFQTRNIEGIPIALPDGVSRAHYMAYKGMAAAAAPERLKNRRTDI